MEPGKMFQTTIKAHNIQGKKKKKNTQNKMTTFHKTRASVCKGKKVKEHKDQ